MGRIATTAIGIRLACLAMFLALPAVAFGQAVRAWPQADRLFRSDPSWLGGDGAFSIDLRDGRVLWLFGDSFVARKRGETRKDAAFVRNSIAIEQGYDPSHAPMKFFEGERNGAPADFVATSDKTWLWPLHGVMLDGRLLLFYARIKSDANPKSLGFLSVGWTAFLVENPRAVPTRWARRELDGPDQRERLLVGTSVIRLAEFVYAYALDDASHDAYLLRWTVLDAERGLLTGPQWWCGDSAGWCREASRRQVVLQDAGPEFSVQRARDGSGFIEVEISGFGMVPIRWRRAARLTGPWSAPQILYRPPGGSGDGLLVYGAKSHPELSAGRDVVVSYATNGPASRLLTDMTIGFPKFVRARFAGISKPGTR